MTPQAWENLTNGIEYLLFAVGFCLIIYFSDILDYLKSRKK